MLETIRVVPTRLLLDHLDPGDGRWRLLIGFEIYHPSFGVGSIENVKSEKYRDASFGIAWKSGRESVVSTSSFIDRTIPRVILPEGLPIPAPFNSWVRVEESDEFREHKRRLLEQAKRRNEEVAAAAERERTEEARRKYELREQERQRQEASLEQERLQRIEALRTYFGDCLPDSVFLDLGTVQALEELANGHHVDPQREDALYRGEQYLALAVYFDHLFQKQLDLGLLARACGLWRRAGQQSYAIERAKLAEGLDRPPRKVSQVWTTRGASHADLGEYDQALDCGDRAISLDKGRPHPYNLLGRVYCASGQTQAGADHFERAMELARYDVKDRRLVALEIQRTLRTLPPQERHSNEARRLEALLEVPF